MCITASNWAWKQKLSAAKKLLLLALADHADENGECYPGLNSLAKKCNTSRGAVIRTRDYLEANGFLSFKDRFYGERQTSNYYTLNIQKE